jgi:hypothetical protein
VVVLSCRPQIVLEVLYNTALRNHDTIWGKWGYDPNTNRENGILIRSEKVQHDPRIVSVWYDLMHSTIRHDTNRGQYITIRLHTANPAQYDTTRYDTRHDTNDERDKPIIQYTLRNKGSSGVFHQHIYKPLNVSQR